MRYVIAMTVAMAVGMVLVVVAAVNMTGDGIWTNVWSIALIGGLVVIVSGVLYGLTGVPE